MKTAVWIAVVGLVQFSAPFVRPALAYAPKAVPVAVAVSPMARPQKGFISQGKCFVCYADGKGTLKVGIGSSANAAAPETVTGSTLFGIRPVIWQFGHDRLWVVWQPGQPGFDLPDYLASYRMDNILKGCLSPRKDGMWNIGGYLHFGPLLYYRTMESIADCPNRMRYDYWPRSDSELMQFVLTDLRVRIVPKAGSMAGKDEYEAKQTAEERNTLRWSFSVYRISGRVDRDAGILLEPKFRLIETLEVAFTESFQVIGKGDTYYFITASGKLYRTGERGFFLTNRRYVETVWDDPAQPITHFLTDTDSDRTFVFCRSKKGNDTGKYFELAPKAEPKACDLSKIEAVKAEEPLKGALETRPIPCASETD